MVWQPFQAKHLAWVATNGTFSTDPVCCCAILMLKLVPITLRLAKRIGKLILRC
jgi:hypothetical protein